MSTSIIEVLGQIGSLVVKDDGRESWLVYNGNTYKDAEIHAMVMTGMISPDELPKLPRVYSED